MLVTQTDTASAADLDQARQLAGQIMSGWQTQALYVAAHLKLADRLADGPMETATLAKLTGSDAGSLLRLLRALCTLGICQETMDGCFTLTASGQLLSTKPSDGAVSLRPLALWWGGPLWPMWGELLYSVQTGQSARRKLTGKNGYEHLEDTSEAAVFHHAMQSLTAIISQEIAQCGTWAHAHSVVDVGGGNGHLALAIVGKHPHLHAIVLDQESARAAADALIESKGLASRCRFECGNFFEPWPAGADRYLLKSILHNWSDADCDRILAHCRQAMPERGRILLVERVRPDRFQENVHDQALARTDLNMLAGLGGCERSQAEFTAMLDTAGLKISNTYKTSFEFTLIEARISSI